MNGKKMTKTDFYKMVDDIFDHQPNTPFCWKCVSKITKKNDDSSSLVGCKEEPKIKDYNDAKKMCPLMREDN